MKATDSELRLVGDDEDLHPLETLRSLWGTDWLTEPPPPRDWLLRYEDAGALACGIVGLLVAPGGRGKTFALAQLAMAVATGRPWLGAFEVARPGRVVLALAEEDERELRERLYLAAQSLELTAEEMENALCRIHPVAIGVDVPVALIQPCAGSARGTRQERRERRERSLRGTLIPSDLHRSFVGELREGCAETIRVKYPALYDAADDDPLSLVILDPLSKWAPGAETSTEAASAAVAALDAIARLPDRPTVLVAHHTSQTDRMTSGNDTTGVRGVTALTDSVRWVAKLTGRSETDLAIAITKSNYSRPGVRVPLIRGEHGLLRRASAAEQAAAAEEHAAVADERVRAMADELVRNVAASSKTITSQASMRPLMTGKNEFKNAAIKLAIDSGRLVRPQRRGDPWRVAESGASVQHHDASSESGTSPRDLTGAGIGSRGRSARTDPRRAGTGSRLRKVASP